MNSDIVKIVDFKKQYVYVSYVKSDVRLDKVTQLCV